MSDTIVRALSAYKIQYRSGRLIRNELRAAAF